MKKLFLLVFSLMFSTTFYSNPHTSIDKFSFKEKPDLSNHLISESDSIFWLPLEVDNRWHYKVVHAESWQDWLFYSRQFITTRITDSTYVDNKKYYLINGFFGFPNGTLIRYEADSLQIIIYWNNTDYVFMDFSLPDSSTFLQIQPDNYLLDVKVVTQTKTIMDSTIFLKGFYKEISYYTRKRGWYYFSQGLGFVYQDEWTNWWWTTFTDYDLIECILLIPPADTLHKKHSYHPDIHFNPIFYLQDSVRLKQEFTIAHEYSRISWPNYAGISYIDITFLESYYSNGMDTIINLNYNIIPLTEIDFSLNFPIDTNLYNQGYHLYYRIVAKDKGLIPAYYYKPDSGYYKLYWRDSTTNINFKGEYSIDYSLSQNYPNPFNPSTVISYQLPVAGDVTLRIYDVLGRKVATLVNEEKPSGIYEVEFDAGNLASGVYYYQLKAGSFIETKKMMVIK